MILSKFKKGWNIVKRLTLIAIISLGWILITPSLTYAAESEIPSGTNLILKTTQDISPDKFALGDKVDLLVVSDINVKGVTLIKAGAPGKGTVTSSIKKGNVGAAAKIGISIEQVQAVDGSWIPISGTKFIEGKDKQTQSIIFTILCCILFLFQKGDNAVITSDMQINATVISDVAVSVP